MKAIILQQHLQHVAETTVAHNTLLFMIRSGMLLLELLPKKKKLKIS